MHSDRKRKLHALLQPESLNPKFSTLEPDFEKPRRFFIIGTDDDAGVHGQSRQTMEISRAKRPKIEVVDSSKKVDIKKVGVESDATLSALQKGIRNRKSVNGQDEAKVMGEDTALNVMEEDISNTESESDLDSDSDTTSCGDSELDLTTSSTSESDSDEESSSGEAERTFDFTSPNLTKEESSRTSDSERPPPTSLLSRLQEFMPLLKASNDALFAPHALNSDAVSMETLTGTEEQLIEIDLGLGVLEHRPDEDDSDNSVSNEEEAEDVKIETERSSRCEVLAKLKGESDSTARRAMIQEVGP